MADIKEAFKIAHHGAEIAKGIDENNTAKIVINSVGLGLELGMISKNNNDSLQSRFDLFISEWKLAAGANNPFIIKMGRLFAPVDEQPLDDELQRLIAAIEVYLTCNGLSTDVPLLNLFKSRHGIPITLSDLEEGFEIIKQLDIYNIKQANVAQPPDVLANILNDYELFMGYIIKKFKDELGRRDLIISQ